VRENLFGRIGIKSMKKPKRNKLEEKEIKMRNENFRFRHAHEK